MLEATVTIINRLGLHARAAAKFVKTASQFASEVSLARGTQRVNGKSIMGVMMLAAAKGSELTLVTEGDDEAQAMQALQTLIDDKFGEGE